MDVGGWQISGGVRRWDLETHGLAAALQVPEHGKVRRKCTVQYTPASAPRCRMDRASFGLWLASCSQVADLGNHCPEGCVRLRSTVLREGACCTEYPALSDPSVPAWWPIQSITALCGGYS